MRFLRVACDSLIGSGKLFYNHECGGGESCKFKKLKNQELDESSRRHPEKRQAAEDQTLPLWLWAAYGHRYWTRIKFLVLKSLTSDFLFFYWPSYGSMIFRLNKQGLLKKQNSCGNDDLMCLHVHYSKSNEFLNMLCSTGKKQVFHCSLDCQFEHTQNIMKYLTFVK